MHDSSVSAETHCKVMLLTVTGSSNGDSISAWRRNTLPLHALHNILSNGGIRSLRMTPATNLVQNKQIYGLRKNKFV